MGEIDPSISVRVKINGFVKPINSIIVFPVIKYRGHVNKGIIGLHKYLATIDGWMMKEEVCNWIRKWKCHPRIGLGNKVDGWMTEGAGQNCTVDNLSIPAKMVLRGNYRQ